VHSLTDRTHGQNIADGKLTLSTQYLLSNLEFLQIPMTHDSNMVLCRRPSGGPLKLLLLVGFSAADSLSDMTLGSD
jgi:hypothetical protein